MTILNPSSISGRVDALLVNPNARDSSISTGRVDDVSVTFEGFAGERHSGLTSEADVRYKKQYARGTPIRNTRQVTILACEELAAIATALEIASVEPEWLGGNLLVSGIPDLTLLPPSTRLLFSSGAALVVDNENAACASPADVVDGHHPGTRRRFIPAARQKRGLVAWVEKEGQIKVGDDIAVHLPPARLYPHA